MNFKDFILFIYDQYKCFLIFVNNSVSSVGRLLLETFLIFFFMSLPNDSDFEENDLSIVTATHWNGNGFLLLSLVFDEVLVI